MILGVVKEIARRGTSRGGASGKVRKYRDMGFEVLVEAGAGAGVFRRDEEYVEAGAEVVADAKGVVEPG